MVEASVVGCGEVIALWHNVLRVYGCRGRIMSEGVES